MIENDDVFCSFGLHPHFADSWVEIEKSFEERLLSDEKIVAAGEMGLDYSQKYSFSFRNRNRIGTSSNLGFVGA